MKITLPNNWNPRSYQLPAWKALQRGIKRAVLIWHRRSGKDDVCLHWAATQLIQKVGNYWHLLPQKEQARKAVWEAINPHTGNRRIDDVFPLALRNRTLDQSMLIEFKNGSTWQLAGADRFDALVGSTPIGITVSEFALTDPRTWAYLRPILRENKGWAVFITTPRGKNHAWRMYTEHKDNPSWYVQTLPATETNVLSAEELHEERQEYMKEMGDDGESLFRQEYLCDFEAALVGTYFAKQISQAREQKRITDLPYDPRMLVHTSWDLGMSDSTAIWFWQVSGQQVRLIDYLEDNNKGLEWYAACLREKGYTYGDHYLPHDVSVTTIDSACGMSRKETLESLGIRVSVVPRVAQKAEAVNAIRNILPRCVFDESKCHRGIEALAQYRRAWNAERKTFADKEFQDWTNHAVDAFDGMARSVNSITDKDEWSRPLNYPKVRYA